mgnify:CR=1 FL=1|tara:strand:+ start:1350 stop:1544 length:195 start_codon:yes stop_codon:yes gene_type:complete
MPSHYNTKGKKKMNEPKKKMNVVMRLKEHSKHHTKKHMAEMRKLMRQGKTFDEAHNSVMKTIGK